MTPPRRLLAGAACAGLLTGFVEVGLLAVQRHVLHRLIFLGNDFWWMAPLANLVWFGGLGLCFVGLQALRPARQLWPLAAGSYAALGSFAVLLMYPPLHRGAALLIAVGIGIQVARMIATPRRWVDAALRVGTPALAGLVVLLALVPRGIDAVRERQSAGRLHASEAGTAPPNVLLIILDTVRAMSLSLYGYERETTPALTRWAARGVVFEHAVSPAPWTLPSHASLLTGRWPYELGVDWRVALDERYPTLAETLRARGYRTAGFMANTTYCSEESGLHRGFEHWEAYPVSWAMVVKSSSLGRAVTGSPMVRNLVGNHQPLARRHAPDISGAFLRWLDPGAQPFFVALNYLDAHAPYLPPQGFRGKFGPSDGRRNVALTPGWDWTPEEIAQQRNAYDESIAFLDAELGRLFESLEVRGALRNTLVIVTADHGEEFYEHGVMDHGNTLYYPSVHVPLLIWMPGRVPAERRVATPVSTREVPATILDLLGISGHPIPGSSLARHWSLPPVAAEPGDTILAEVRYASGLPERYPVSQGDLHSAMFGSVRYLLNGNGSEELYDLSTDPGERHNLIADSSRVRALERLRGAARVAQTAEGR